MDLLTQISLAGLPEPEPEFRFLEGRRFRFDCAWPVWKVAVDVQGGIWSRGAHVRGKGYRRDCEKLNEAQLAGWVFLWATTDMVRDGRALAFVERALQLRRTEP